MDHESGTGERAVGRATLHMEASSSEKAVMRKVDQHILPFFFGLALLCSIDRGALCSRMISPTYAYSMVPLLLMLNHLYIIPI